MMLLSIFTFFFLSYVGMVPRRWILYPAFGVGIYSITVIIYLCLRTLCMSLMQYNLLQQVYLVI